MINIKKKIYKKRNFFSKKRRIFIIGISIYTFFIILITSNKEKTINFAKQILPKTTKIMLRNSIPLQLYESKFNVNLPFNIIKGYFEKVEPIQLNIKQDRLNKLEQKRKEAISKGVLITADDDFVNAVIANKSYASDVKIRLKGDWSDHLSSNKPSFRVNVKKDKTFLGMKVFSLQAPYTRNYIWEWLYHKLLKEAGLPALRYDFKPLIINGSYRGIYAIEEHFDKVLLESNNFKEGPIIRFSESRYWQQIAKDSSTFDEYYKSYSTGFKIKKINKNQLLKKDFAVANQLLNGFHDKSLTTSEVFDIKLLAKFFAISDLIGARHALNWHNLRFYYDPIRSKLIPIGFDGNPNKKIFSTNDLSLEMEDIFTSFIFKDQEFTKEYIKNLSQVSKKIYLDEFFKKFGKEFNEKVNTLYKSYPALKIDRNFLYSNQKKIQKYLNPYSPLNIFVQSINDSKLILSIGNNQPIPIEIESLEIGNNKKDISEIYEGKKNKKFIIYQEIEIPITKEIFNKLNNSESIFINYKVVGTNNSGKIEANSFPRFEPLKVKNMVIRKNSDINKINFLNINKEKKVIEFIPGIINLNKPLIIPEGYTLEAFSGVHLKINEKGLLISKSPIKFIGSADKKIIIESSDKDFGNGILILDANKISIIKNVSLKNLESIDQNYWSLSGAITFYQSPVLIEDSLFENSKSEDSLNIVRSTFNIKNTIFKNSKSDAIDIDFSKGNLSNITIKNSFNDGLDLSGSEIIGQDISITKSGDKALSIGEQSFVDIKNLFVNESFIGIANKDASITNIENLEIKSSKIDVASFQKKYEYAPSNIRIINFNKNLNQLNYLLGEDSKLNINSKFLKQNSDNKSIFKMLYKN